MVAPSGRPVRVRSRGLPRGRHRVRGDAPGAGARRTAPAARLRRGRDVDRGPRPAADALAQPHPRRRLHLRRPRPPPRPDRAGQGHAIHGLARWAAWSPEEHGATSVSLSYRLMAQSGYPWTVDLHVLYDLSAERADRDPDRDQPQRPAGAVRLGAHPYLRAGRLRSTAGSSTLPASRGCSPTSARSPWARRTSPGRPTTSGWPGRCATSGLDDGFGDLGADDGRSSPPRWCATRRPASASRCGSTGTHPLADGLQRRRRMGPAAAGARGRADDGSARRVPQRTRPADAGARRGARRRGVSLLGDPGARVTRRRCGRGASGAGAPRSWPGRRRSPGSARA